MSETEMSSFGRGLQPRFTLEYRAMGDLAAAGGNIDKWFCGSYRDMVPDHYQLGYQICSYAYTRYGENIWDKVARFSVRNPYLFFTNPVALKSSTARAWTTCSALRSPIWRLGGHRFRRKRIRPHRSLRCRSAIIRPTAGLCRWAIRRCWR